MWIAATLIASLAQTGRNAAQMGLTARIGTMGATGVRFVFGLPFALLFLAMAALVGPNIVGNLDKSRVKSTKAQLVSVKNAVQQYYMDMSTYPTRLDELITNPGNEKWDGPYLEAKSIPKDGWGNDFQYSVPGQDNMPFDIISYGGDKSSGGTGNNEDISCWN